MKQIKEWVEQNHDSDVKDLSELSDICYRTLSRYIKDNNLVVDDDGNMYKKIGVLKARKPIPIINMKVDYAKKWLKEKKAKRANLCLMNLIPPKSNIK